MASRNSVQVLDRGDTRATDLGAMNVRKVEQSLPRDLSRFDYPFARERCTATVARPPSPLRSAGSSRTDSRCRLGGNRGLRRRCPGRRPCPSGQPLAVPCASRPYVRHYPIGPHRLATGLEQEHRSSPVRAGYSPVVPPTKTASHPALTRLRRQGARPRDKSTSSSQSNGVGMAATTVGRRIEPVIELSGGSASATHPALGRPGAGSCEGGPPIYCLARRDRCQ